MLLYGYCIGVRSSRSDGLRAAMTARLQSEAGKACSAKRKQTVDPVFGQIKSSRPRDDSYGSSDAK